MNSPDISAESRHFVELLCRAIENSATESSPEKSSPLPTRGAVRTRGAVTVAPPAAATRSTVLPPADPVESAIRQLREQAPEVREEVVNVLGERGDAVAAQALSTLAAWEPLRRLRLRIAGALALGRVDQSVDGLMRLAREDPDEEVRAEAIRLLGARALRTWPGLAVRTRGVVRVRGAVRTRGATRTASSHLSPQAQAVLGLLDKARFQDPSLTVRFAADDTLGKLDE